jgi:hypothetical protein
MKYKEMKNIQINMIPILSLITMLLITSLAIPDAEAYYFDTTWQRDAPPQVIQDTDPKSRNSLAFKERIVSEVIKAEYTKMEMGY